MFHHFFSFILFTLEFVLNFKNKKEMKKKGISENLGGKIMIAQEQYIHQKRLNEIYRKRPELSSNTVNYDYLIRFSSRNPMKMTKSAFNEEMNHHLTLKHLIQRLNSPKSYADRLKDDHDFIAHPSLFFRYILQQL